jgi:hypothetical protein
MDINPPESMNMKFMLPATERFRTTRVGAITVSGITTSTTTKMMSKTAKVAKRQMIFGADQE